MARPLTPTRPIAQVTAGPCTTPKPFWNQLERAKWNSWNSLGSLSTIDAMRMYVSGIEDENPDWYDLVTNDGDEERVREVAEAAAEAVAAAGMDAKAQLARLDDRGDGGQKDQPSPRTPGPPPAGRRSLGRSPRPSADNLTQSVSRSSLSSRDPPLDPAVAKIPCLEDGTWTDVTYAVGGAKPRGRSGHASVRIGASEVWTVGGVRNGRRIADVCVFDTIKMEWAGDDELRCSMKPGEVDVAHLTGWPARSGHAAVVFGTKILVIGGHTREDDPVDAQCEVWVLETTSREWSRLKVEGDAPCARGGHTATMVEGKGGRNPRVVVFGGEDRRGRLLDDARVLDLTKMRWIEDERTRTNKAPRGRGAPAPTWPAARSGHVACCFGYGSPDVYVFGGVKAGDAGEPTDELFCLNSMTMTWHRLNPAGVTPAPRTNCAGCVLDDGIWLIIGGGNGGGGLADTVGLKLANPRGVGANQVSGLEWFTAGEVQRGSALAAEGMTCVSVGGNPGECGAVIAFGGYDGRRYSNCTHAMRRPGRARMDTRGETKPREAAREVGDASGHSARSVASPAIAAMSRSNNGSAVSLRRVSSENSEIRRLRSENEAAKEALRRANERLAELGAAPIDFAIGDESGSGDKRSPPPPTRRRGLWAFISGGDADDVDSGYDSPAR